MQMQKIIDIYLAEIRDLISLGLGRKAGSTDRHLSAPMESLPHIIWAESRRQAEQLQEQDELSDFLLFLRPDGEFATRDAKRNFDQTMNEVAARVRPAIVEMTSDLQVLGITNEPVGLGASDAIETFRAVAISGAQERVAELDFGLLDPLPCRDLLTIYRNGHILCGYIPEGDGQCVIY